MEKQLVVVLSCLIFLITAFLFEQVLPALGVTTFFLFAVFILERESPRWAKKVGRITKKWLKIVFSRRTFDDFVLPTMFSLAVFFLLYLPIEFLITEVWFIVPRLSRSLSVAILLIFILIFNLIDWFKLLSAKRAGKITFLLILIIGIITYGLARGEKLAREYLPKIYRLSPTWGIQGNVVRVEGVNFGLPHNKGLVFIGNETESSIKLWSENLVVFEQNVPRQFGVFNLYILRKDGVRSNQRLFKIGNPDELKWPIEK